MNVAIIGGGVGGMLSALFLSKQGVQVTIYEKEARLGGRLAFVERDGYRIDKGPTIVLLPEMFQQLLDEAGISRKEYELILCDPLYSIQFPDGFSFTKYPDINRQLEELKRVFPLEIEGFQRFMKEGRYRFEIGKAGFLEQTFSDAKTFWTSDNIRKLLKLKPYQSVQKLMSKYFQDERLQTAYGLQSLYIGGNPFQTPAIYSLVSFAEHEYGVHYLKGGYASLVPLLEKELNRRDVRIYFNSEVTNISTNGRRVAGVETKEGFESYDAVVFNGDFPNIDQLLQQKAKRSFTPSSSCVLLYFGLNRVYKNRNIHQYFMGKSFSDHMKAVFEQKSIPEDPAIYTFHPSIIDPSLAPEGKGVLYALIPVPSDTRINWHKEREWTEKIIDRLEELSFPELRDSIEWMEICNPEEAEKFGLYKGGSFGIAPILFQSGVFRPQVKPFPLENLYAVGASVHPGGGIPLVMQGAKLLSDHILSDQPLKGVKAHV
ncbi:phytoene desaturase family protein [Metabacillus fastidiosus]|uniref:phytoene desaturase family protein n=1 Tax=Metabacillus fastidiosus TaxID=1458 RepID=UPI002E21BE0A|nr:phytoene desaturase family protein [Metabacillus fastidiosus]MED4533165.1 phytoene desaturase family protein [Metabacillus fastidiosus]